MLAFSLGAGFMFGILAGELAQFGSVTYGVGFAACIVNWIISCILAIAIFFAVNPRGELVPVSVAQEEFHTTIGRISGKQNPSPQKYDPDSPNFPSAYMPEKDYFPSGAVPSGAKVQNGKSRNDERPSLSRLQTNPSYPRSQTRVPEILPDRLPSSSSRTSSETNPSYPRSQTLPDRLPSSSSRTSPGSPRREARTRTGGRRPAMPARAATENSIKRSDEPRAATENSIKRSDEPRAATENSIKRSDEPRSNYESPRSYQPSYS
jgi:hypothetical protein